MSTKHKIEVRRYLAGQTAYGSESIGKITGNFGRFEIVETIARKPWLECIGNFNPMFCRYHGKRTLVNSDRGDISDPFRRDESYLSTLFIEIK